MILKFHAFILMYDLRMYGDCSINNWLYSTGIQWTMTASSSSYDYSLVITIYNWDSSASTAVMDSYNSEATRPTVYLKKNVYVSSGDGSFENPYVLED